MAIGSKQFCVVALAAGVASAACLAPRPARADPAPDQAARPPLPEPRAAFGAALLGADVYVLGGHRGPPHGFSTASESGAFLRLDVTLGSAWETLEPVRPGVEGAALAVHGGRIVRVGGLRVDNAPGEAADLRSVDLVQSYDPASGAWADLTPLPEGRSAHGAAVIGDRLYVVGGWELGGGMFSGGFHAGGLVLDLSRPGDRWQPVPAPPFKLRSLAVAAVGDAIYAIGGATDVPGEFSDAVYAFDTAAGVWSTGPRLPAHSSIAGFGAAACSVGGALYVNDADGLYRLSAGADHWESVAATAAKRVFGALVCLRENELLALGGYVVTAGGLQITADVETISLPSAGAP